MRNEPIGGFDSFGQIGDWSERWEGEARPHTEQVVVPETGESVTVRGQTRVTKWDVSARPLSLGVCCKIDHTSINGAMATHMWFVEGDTTAQAHETSHVAGYHDNWSLLKSELLAYEDMGWQNCDRCNCYAEVIALVADTRLKLAYYLEVESDNGSRNPSRYLQSRLDNARRDYENALTAAGEKEVECSSL